MAINQLNNGDSGLTARTIINDLVTNVNSLSGSYTGSFTGSFIGNLTGQADTAQTALVAVFYNETDPVFTAKESTLITTSSFNLYTGSSTSQFAGTASYVNLIAGPGVDINGLEVTSLLRTVNSIFPVNGNVAVSLSSTTTGTSASLVASSSGAITSSLADGLVWIISNDPTPANNGDVYIWNSGSSQWLEIAPLDQSAGDSRYLMLDPQSSLIGDLDLGGNNITNIGVLIGTASWAQNSITASYVLNSVSASYVNLIAGPNTTINYVNNGIEISSSTAGTPGGPENSIQFNSGSELNGSSNFTYDNSTNTLLVSGSQLDGDGFINVRTETGHEVALGSKDISTEVGLYENIGGTSIAIYDFASNKFIYGSAALQIIKNYYNGDDAVFISSIGNYPQSASLVVGGNVYADSYTGSLQGTASWAENSISASFTATASYALNAANIDTGSLINTSSFNNFTGSVVTTSSFNDFTGSVVTTSSFNDFTGSVVTTSSFNDFTGSVVTTSSFNSFTSSINSYTGSSTSQFAGTASFVNLTAGPGITINGLEITSSVRSVNGIFPTNGNIAITLSSTETGTSASLVASSSGAITGSLTDGLIWIISNDPTPANNGDVYIWNSGSSQWLPIAPLDQSAGDSRYLMLDPQSPLVNLLDLGGNNIINVGNMLGTASWAQNSISSSYATTASYISSTGPESSIQFVTSGILSGSSRFIFDKNNNEVVLTGSLVVRNFPATRNNVFNTDIPIIFQNPSQLSGYGYINPWNGGYFEVGAVSAAGLRLYGSGAPITISTNNTLYPIYITPGGGQGQVILSGSLYVSNSLYLNGLTLSSSQQILSINTSSGQIHYIPSSNLTILSSSYALSASFASSASLSTTASYVLNAVSSSYATTASYVLNAVSSSYTTTSSYALTAQTAFIANQAGIATLATSSLTSSFITASNVFGPYGSNSILSASYALNANSASYATSSSLASTASSAVSSSYAISSSYALSASFATSSSKAISSSFATIALTATTSSYVLNAVSSSFSTTASYALNAANVDVSSLVTTSSFNAFTGSVVTTSSFNTFTSSINTWTGSSTSQFAGTASYINLVAGPGITVNGLQITSSVRTVNGVSPVNGNIAISLSSTKTGTSASLVVSSSGAVTSSLADGLIWIISGDPTPANNGDTYIWNSGSSQWLPIAPLDQAAGDARYLMLNPILPLVGNLSLGGNNITNVGTMFGTASWAQSSSQALTASYVNGNIFTSNNLALSASFAVSSSRSVSSSFATTASYVLNAVSASFATSSSRAVSSSFATTASYVLNAVSSSFATTASHALNAGITILNNTNDNILTATGLTNVVNGESNLTFNGSTLSVTGNVTATSLTGSLLGTASFAVSSSRSTTSSFAITASYALNGGGGSTPIPVSAQSVQITPGVTSFNFTGNGVTATNAGNAVTVNIPGSTAPASTVNSIDTFWGLANTTTYTDYLVRAFDANTTTGGGYFKYYNLPNSSITNIAGIRIKTNTSTGYWERVYSGAIQVDWFGVRNSTSTLASLGITQGTADTRYGLNYDGTSLINVNTDTYDFAAIQYAFKIAELPGFGAIEFTNRRNYYMNRGAYLPRFQTNSAGAKLAESFFVIDGKGGEIVTTPSYTPTKSTTYAGCTFTANTITIPNVNTPSSILGIGKTVTSAQFAGTKTVTGFSISGLNTILTVDGTAMPTGTNSITVTAPVALFDRICPSQFYALDQGWIETRFHISNFNIKNDWSNFGDVSCAIRLGPTFGSHIHDMEIQGFNKIIWLEFCLNTKLELIQFNYLDYGIYVDYGEYWGGNNSNSQSNITLIKQCRGYGLAGSAETRTLTLSGTSVGTNSCTVTLDGVTYGPGYIDTTTPGVNRPGFTLPVGSSDVVATSLVDNNNNASNINYLLFGQNYTTEPDLQGWTVSKPAANQIRFTSNLRGPKTGSYSFNGGGSGITGTFTQNTLGTQNSITPFFIRGSYDCEIWNSYCEGSAPMYAVYFDTAASTVVKNFKISKLGVETPCTEASIFMRAGDGNYEIDSVTQLTSKNFLTFINISGNPKLDISRIISFNYPAYFNFNDHNIQPVITRGDDFNPPWTAGLIPPGTFSLTSGSNSVSTSTSTLLNNVQIGDRVADVNNNATLSIPPGAIVSSKGTTSFTMHFKNGQSANARITRTGNAELYFNRISNFNPLSYTLNWSHPYSPFIWRRGPGSYQDFKNQTIIIPEQKIPGPLWRAGAQTGSFSGPNTNSPRLIHIPNMIKSATGQPYNGL